MASVNKVIIVGNLGADPETRYLPSGDAVTNIRVATTDRFKDKASGDMKEMVEWHRAVFFGRLAEIAGEYLKKGSSVYIEGRIRTRKWNDQSGQERYSTEIVGEQMQMLGGRGNGGGDGGGGDGGEEGGGRSASRGNASRTNGNGNGGGSSNSGNAGSGGRASAPAPAGGGFEDYDDDIPF